MLHEGLNRIATAPAPSTPPPRAMLGGIAEPTYSRANSILDVRGFATKLFEHFEHTVSTVFERLALGHHVLLELRLIRVVERRERKVLLEHLQLELHLEPLALLASHLPYQVRDDRL